jgi:hypothetical protein
MSLIRAGYRLTSCMNIQAEMTINMNNILRVNGSEYVAVEYVGMKRSESIVPVCHVKRKSVSILKYVIEMIEVNRNFLQTRGIV